MRIQSKRKGSRFERVVAKFFTEWSGFNFGRTPQSGAYHNNRDLGSDLICNDDKHKNKCCISVECKNYQDIRFEHVLLGNKHCKIFDFWKQAYRDAKRTKKFPILCMRYNSMPRGEFFFVVDSVIAKEVICPWITRTMEIKAPELEIPLYVFMASEIKEHCSYKSIHKALRKEVKKFYK